MWSRTRNGYWITFKTYVTWRYLFFQHDFCHLVTAVTQKVSVKSGYVTWKRWQEEILFWFGVPPPRAKFSQNFQNFFQNFFTLSWGLFESCRRLFFFFFEISSLKYRRCLIIGCNMHKFYQKFSQILLEIFPNFIPTFYNFCQISLKRL